ncbi:hypothetical protein C0J52_16491 [Blattella germanica]|nr:hypothetical protein C0J52_16491 [Blattella germanica]
MFLIFIDMFVGDDLDMKNAAVNAGSNEQLHPASIPENYCKSVPKICNCPHPEIGFI